MSKKSKSPDENLDLNDISLSLTKTPTPNINNIQLFPKNVVISITTHGIYKSDSLRKGHLKNFKFREKIKNSKITLIKAAPFGLSNYGNGKWFETCNLKILKEFKEYLKKKKKNLEEKKIIYDFYLSSLNSEKTPSPILSISSTSSSISQNFQKNIVSKLKANVQKKIIPMIQTKIEKIKKYVDDLNLMKTKKNQEINEKEINEIITNEEICVYSQYLVSQNVSPDVCHEKIQDIINKKNYIYWFHDTFQVEEIKNNNTFYEKFLYVNAFDQKNEINKNNDNIFIFYMNTTKKSSTRKSNSSFLIIKSLFELMNIQPTKKDDETGMTDDEKLENTEYNTTLSDVINFVNCHGAKNIKIIDFSCSNIENDDEEYITNEELQSFRVKYNLRKSRKQKRKERNENENDTYEFHQNKQQKSGCRIFTKKKQKP